MGMSSFGEKGRSIDDVHSLSDYDRHRVLPHEMESITHFQPLLNWWKKVDEEGQGLPSRADFNPVAFQSIIPNIAILDLIYEQDVVIDCRTALIGTALAEVYGEATGKLTTEINNEYVTQTILEAVRECVRTRQPVGIIAKAATENLPFLRSFVLYCPLATDRKNIDKVAIHISFESNSS